MRRRLTGIGTRNPPIHERGLGVAGKTLVALWPRPGVGIGVELRELRIQLAEAMTGEPSMTIAHDRRSIPIGRAKNGLRERRQFVDLDRRPRRRIGLIIGGCGIGMPRCCSAPAVSDTAAHAGVLLRKGRGGHKSAQQAALPVTWSMRIVFQWRPPRLVKQVRLVPGIPA